MNQLPCDGRVIARATLFVLAASAGAPSHEIRYRLGASGVPDSTDAAVDYLVKLPKPVHCLGKLLGDTLQVTCTRADPESRWRDVERVLDRIRAGFVGTDQPEEDTMVLFRRGSATMLFPLRCFREWFANYRLQDYSMSVRSNDRENRELGAIVTLNIGPGPRIIREEIRE